jgi:hypothetical protein
MSDEIVEAPLGGLFTPENSGIFDEVDSIIERSLAVGDPLIALEYAQNLQKGNLVRGLAIAKLMYKMKQNWNLFEVAGVGDTFENLVQSMNGYAPATVEKYVRMWESIFANDSLSDELKNQLSGRPIRDLLLLTAAAREGSLSDEDWDKVKIAGDTSRVREIIRGARGEQTSSKNSLTLLVQVREGVVPRGTVSVSLNGNRRTVCSLDLDSTDEVIRNANARIIQRSGMIEV